MCALNVQAGVCSVQQMQRQVFVVFVVCTRCTGRCLWCLWCVLDVQARVCVTKCRHSPCKPIDTSEETEEAEGQRCSSPNLLEVQHELDFFSSLSLNQYFHNCSMLPFLKTTNMLVLNLQNSYGTSLWLICESESFIK